MLPLFSSKKAKNKKNKKGGLARLFALFSIKQHKISTGITHLYEFFIGGSSH